jgi:hypothetical protein
MDSKNIHLKPFFGRMYGSNMTTTPNVCLIFGLMAVPNEPFEIGVWNLIWK